MPLGLRESLWACPGRGRGPSKITVRLQYSWLLGALMPFFPVTEGILVNP